MRKALLLSAGLLLATLPVQPANAWFRGGGWGGMHEGAFGGHWGAVGGGGRWGAGGVTATGHAWGAAGNGYGWRGASTSGVRAGGNYDGWSAVGPDGHWATGSRYYGGAYGGYVHSPAVVNGYYGGVGCYYCGGWGAAAGLAAGAVAGAAVAGAATAAAATTAAASGYYPIGATYAALPAGCAYTPYSGLTYYSCYGSWFRPYYGANGTYYDVVAAP